MTAAKRPTPRDVSICRTHLGNPDTTLVEANRCMIGRPSDHLSLARQPDLIIAIDVDPAAYAVNNGCVVSEQ